MRRLIIAMALAAAALFAGCSGLPATGNNGSGKIVAVTTLYPLADILQNIGGEAVEVHFLLPPGASPHTYEPTVDQMMRVAAARLFVSIGGGLDDWALVLADAAPPGIVLLKLLEEPALPLLEYRHDHHGHHDEGEACQNGVHDDHHDCEHGHGPADPHIWLDPLIVRDIICPALADALCDLDPAGKAYYRSNLSAYQARLSALDEEIRAALAGSQNRGFISFHSAWRYFARRYDLEEVAVITPFPGQEPSAAWMAELVGLSRAHGINVIFVEPQFSPAVAHSIAGEIKGRVAVLDPLGGPGASQANTYIDMMRYNLAVFKEALSD